MHKYDLRMAINSKSEYLSRNESNSLQDSPRVPITNMIKKKPISNVSQSAGSLIIHLHKLDNQGDTNSNMNLNLIKEKDTEDEIDQKLDKHFPIKEKEAGINQSNNAAESPKKKDYAIKKIANFIKNSIEKKIQFTYINNNQKEEEVRKPLNEYNIKKIVFKNFEI